jgi:hypothetical protein
MPPDKPRIWTVVIRGPTPFLFRTKGNPAAEHDGGMSVHHLVLRQDEIPAIRGAVLLSGNRVEIRPMEGQTQRQAEERAQFNTLAQEDRVWPSVKCPTCPWFDPLQPDGTSPCGVETWPPETVEELRRTSSQALEALSECPVRGLG